MPDRWGTNAASSTMRAHAGPVAGSPGATVAPNRRAVPRDGRSSPMSTRSVVVFPAPFGPRSPYTCAAVDREGEVLDRADVTELLPQPVDGDDRLTHGHRADTRHAASSGTLCDWREAAA